MFELAFPALCLFFGGFIFGKFVFSPRRVTKSEHLNEQRADIENETIKHALAGQDALEIELQKPEIYLSISYLNENNKVSTLYTDTIMPTMMYNPGGFHVTKAEEHADRMLADMAAKGIYKGLDDNGDGVSVPAIKFLSAKVIKCE